MSYSVRIRDTTTGIERTIEKPGEWDDGSDFMWNEGNYACDCNRRLFFARAAGLPDPEPNPCGEGRYSATILLPAKLDTIDVTIGFATRSPLGQCK